MTCFHSGVALAVGVLFLVSCGSDGPIHDPGRTAGTGGPPEVIVSWSEGGPEADKAWLRANMEPLLIETDAQREEFLGGLPELYVDSASPLSDIDLSSYTLVVAGYSECGNTGEVTVSDGEVSHAVRQTQRIECVWAPMRVQVFRVSGTGLALRR